MLKGFWLSCIVILILPASGWASSNECDKATRDLKLYSSHWDREKVNHKKDQVDDDIKSWQERKAEFDGIYNRYMLSKGSLLIGVLAKFAETIANEYKYFISKLDKTKVVSSAIFCSEAVVKKLANEIVEGVNSGIRKTSSIIGDMATTAYDCKDRALAGFLSGGTEAVALEQMYLDIKQVSNMPNEHDAAVKAFKIAVDRVDNQIEKYKKKSNYLQYMIDQHKVIGGKLNKKKEDECLLVRDDEEEMDNLFLGESDDMFAPTKSVNEGFDFVGAANDIRRKQKAQDNRRIENDRRRAEQEAAQASAYNQHLLNQLLSQKKSKSNKYQPNSSAASRLPKTRNNAKSQEIVQCGARSNMPGWNGSCKGLEISIRATQAGLDAISNHPSCSRQKNMWMHRLRDFQSKRGSCKDF
jgi:hypothetical protein